MDLKLRRLAADDIELMRLLNALFADSFDDAESYSEQPPSDDYVQSFLAAGQHIVLVATHGEQVVGGLVAYHLIKFERTRSEVYVYDLAVARDHQRRGIGKALMTEIRKIAKDLGAYVVFVQADDGDDAVEFYRTLGPSEDTATHNFDFEVDT